MFYVETVFNELVNLDKVQMIYMGVEVGSPLIEKIEPRYSVWAQFSPKFSLRLHTGTKEQCQKAFDEITLNLLRHGAPTPDYTVLRSEWTPEE